MKQLRKVELKRFLRGEKKKLRNEAELIFLLFSVDYQANLGAIFRLADALCVKRIYLTGGTVDPQGETFEKVARYKHRVVAWEREKDPLKAIGDLKRQGFEAVAAAVVGYEMKMSVDG